MVVEYSWNCRTVDLYPTEGDETNVVYNVHWQVIATSDQLDAQNEPYECADIGTQVVDYNPSNTFIPFDELTNEVVVGWTKDAMGSELVSSIENNLYEKIESKINPTSITKTII
tara:strand:- start:54 stop:395 length:342 start_codon:yes stop_codon:yes gene_type:complete